MVVFGLGFVNQPVHGVVKPAFIAKLAVGFHIKRTVYFITETLEFFSQITGVDIRAAGAGFEYLFMQHVSVIGISLKI